MADTPVMIRYTLDEIDAQFNTGLVTLCAEDAPEAPSLGEKFWTKAKLVMPNTKLIIPNSK